MTTLRCKQHTTEPLRDPCPSSESLASVCVRAYVRVCLSVCVHSVRVHASWINMNFEHFFERPQGSFLGGPVPITGYWFSRSQTQMLTGPRCNWTHNHTHAHTHTHLRTHSWSAHSTGMKGSSLGWKLGWKLNGKIWWWNSRRGKKKSRNSQRCLPVSMFAFLSASQLLSCLGPLSFQAKKTF